MIFGLMVVVWSCTETAVLTRRRVCSVLHVFASVAFLLFGSASLCFFFTRAAMSCSSRGFCIACVRITLVSGGAADEKTPLSLPLQVVVVLLLAGSGNCVMGLGTKFFLSCKWVAEAGSRALNHKHTNKMCAQHLLTAPWTRSRASRILLLKGLQIPCFVTFGENNQALQNWWDTPFKLQSGGLLEEI